MENPQVLFVLRSAAQGIKSEAALRAAGVTCALITVPRALSSTCGVCLRVPAEQRRLAEEVLASMGTVISATHEIDAPPRPAGAGKETR